jgi:hydrogenase maturation protein HypF
LYVRRHIDVSGIVQGVGFRPYVYRLATERHLTGTITNTPSGVTIEVQGLPESVEDFMAHLPQDAPPLARIIEVVAFEIPCNGDREFRIIASHRGEAVRTLISPDVAVCDDCLRELFDPKDRRYRYPFINCTNCGPRFTIVRDIPYDRPRTSMAVFPMCPACQAEYDDPASRRFHAQPNACWECGPRLQLLDKSGHLMKYADPSQATIDALRSGHIAVIKGLGGFHLACDATNEAAVALLRERKRRVEKPFAIMVANLEAAKKFCEVTSAESKALQSIQCPIVLLQRKPATPISSQVAPFNHYLGVFLPYTPLHHLLFAEGGFDALVMTSGNLSEEPIAIDNQEAATRLSGLADYFLVHNREILLRCDDSVVRVQGQTTQQLRRSRGFVPVPVFLHKEILSILAVGGELKNTICLTKGKHAFLSQHVGDLENLESYKFFEEAIEHLQRILEIQPSVIAYDLHPDYFSTKWALQSGMQAVGVQHHHAHIASCMAENHLEGEVIGLALDGTGYGMDGHIWGGEVLIACYERFERAAHFECVPMPGGAAAIREPWRMAVSYLGHHFGRDFQKMKLPFLNRVPFEKLDLLLQLIDRRVNSPLTSSCGRLFDAVAALAGIRQLVNYEAQAAIELEMAINTTVSEGAYRLDLVPEGDGWIISTKPLFDELIGDLARDVPVSTISQKFHDGLIDVLARLANLLRERTSLNRVCLGGGTFHNAYLLENLNRRLSSHDLQYLPIRKSLRAMEASASARLSSQHMPKSEFSSVNTANFFHCYRHPLEPV